MLYVSDHTHTTSGKFGSVVTVVTVPVAFTEPESLSKTSTDTCADKLGSCSSWAMTRARPTARNRARPFDSTDNTSGALLDHVTLAPGITSPRLFLTIAWN